MSTSDMHVTRLEGLGTEVLHYFGTTDGWFYRATCGDDDWAVDTVTAHGRYTGSLGHTPSLAAAQQAANTHYLAHAGTEAPQHPTYRTHADGRRS